MNTESQLRNTSSLIGSRIETRNGDTCGKCRDFLFDETSWTVRYVVVDTGGFFTHHEVLLSPFLFANPEFVAAGERMVTTLTRDQIETSPPLESDAPVSRLYEWELARHYQYPEYWNGSSVWGFSAFPIISAPDPALEAIEPEETERHTEIMEQIRETSHLQSCNEVNGYEVLCAGANLGRVADFRVETRAWRIHQLVIKAGEGAERRKLCLCPEWISGISWERQQIEMNPAGRHQLVELPELQEAR